MKRLAAAALPLCLLLGSCAGRPASLPSAAREGWDGGPVAHTAYGAVLGQGDEYGTWVWKAVPFAQPPVGELR